VKALFNNTTGYSNVAIGASALYDNMFKSNLVAVGDSALYNNHAAYNTALGSKTLYTNTSGEANTAVGYNALYTNTFGEANTAVGYNALYHNKNGSKNTAYGYEAGKYIADGSGQNDHGNNNIFIGAETKSLNNNDTNQIVIGYDATGNGSNSVVIGNNNITKTELKGSVGIGTANPAAGAALEVSSTNKGFLPPRVADINAISYPVEGLIIYDISSQCLRHYNGDRWSDCIKTRIERGIKCGKDFVDNRDGQIYHTVLIGSQCWMQENLRIGTKIDTLATPSDNGIIEKWCYKNDSSDCAHNGAYYSWNEMMLYNDNQGTPIQGICPDGWHIPMEEEWKIAEMTLGFPPVYAAGYEVMRGSHYDLGSQFAGDNNYLSWQNGYLKDADKYGYAFFVALPTGYLDYQTHTFEGRGQKARFWTYEKAAQGPTRRYRSLRYNSRTFPNAFTEPVNSGFSVRCLRDY